MTAGTISVARLLTRITKTEATWADSIKSVYADVFKDQKSLNTGKPIDKVCAEAATNLQATNDRIHAIFLQRCAINDSNQVQTITIGKETFTIAQALIYKQHVLPLQRAFLSELRAQIETTKRRYAIETKEWENFLAGKDTALVESLRATLCPAVLLPIDTYTQLDDWIKEFETELSAALSESNALTQISL